MNRYEKNQLIRESGRTSALVWLIAYLVTKEATGWAWYWVAAALFAYVAIDRIAAAFVRRT